MLCCCWFLCYDGERDRGRRLSRLKLLCCCFLCDAERQLVARRRLHGMCSVCAGSVSYERLQNVFRCCFVPVCRVHQSRIVCSRCRAQYKSR